MKKVLIFIVFIGMCFFGFRCSKGDDGIFFPPNSVNLTFPTNNLLCIDNAITFDWTDAENSENTIVTYTVIVAKDRDFTNVVENRTTAESNITLTLDKLTAYYWKVNTLNTQNNQVTNSEVFAFYTKGDGIANYAPFVADLTSPVNKAQVNSGDISLTWEGADANTEDTLSYELYFGESSLPELLESSLSTESHTVTVVSGKTYYWKVNVMDQLGAKTIGQIWSFTVN